jgi:hypothetical protein
VIDLLWLRRRLALVATGVLLVVGAVVGAIVL